MRGIVYTELARSQPTALEAYIEREASAATARHFVDAIVDFCDRLDLFPERGSLRADLLPGLRIVGFRRKVSIAFCVEDDRVLILGVFYGGQSFERFFD